MSGWQEANQRYLTAALAVVRVALEKYLAHAIGKSLPEKAEAEAQADLQKAAAAMPAAAALETVQAKFGLSAFERHVLLLCAGLEFDAQFAALCAQAHGEAHRAYPTFGLALAALPEAHWSAITPVAPLRRWRLLEIGSGGSLTQSALRLDERVLHYLAGVFHADERLQGLLEDAGPEEALVPSHDKLAESIVRAWSVSKNLADWPVVQLCGADAPAKRALAAAGCARLGLPLKIITVQALPTQAGELESLMRLWERESALQNCALLLDSDETDSAEALRKSALHRFVDYTFAPLLLSSRERHGHFHRKVVTFEVLRPTAGEQRVLWQKSLGEEAPAMSPHLDALVSQFSFSARMIQNAVAEARAGVEERRSKIEDRDPRPSPLDPRFSQRLWEACRMHARPRLAELAQRIVPAAIWEDLVLPQAQLQILRDVAAHVRQRAKVYESWGFSSKGARGLGISALFAGASGTGKTMAAEVLANTLHLDLYRIDLSQVVSKYIGETEKNLRRVFDAAEEGGAILLFDEADALFGKRSEVKDSHDRYANIEIGYLLQRMEEYRGLAILTTNMKESLDAAFMRRIRFIVPFSFPDVGQRELIWRRIFPPATPIVGLDFEKLARLNMTGGSIRNTALNAAFLAADAGEAVGMKHILRAARSDYAKMEKSLTEAEVKGWT